MKYVTFIILNKILINIPYSLLLFLNIFLTYFAISGYLSQITVRKQKRMIASYSYCPLYRATFTVCDDDGVDLGWLVIALYIGLLSLRNLGFKVSKGDLQKLLPSISGYFHTTDYNTCSIALPPF
jgi:hypothetical protein